MPTQGLTTFLGGGIRLKNAAASSNYVGLKITANPATSFDVNWLTALPASTQALTITSAGVIGTYSYVDVLTLGTGLSWLTSSANTAGTITLSLTGGQAANQVLATPDGTTGTVALRSLVAGDIPNLSTDKLTSGILPLARGGTNSNNGSITGTGALTFTAGGTNTNVILAPNGTGTVDVSSKRITSVATPTGDNDAVNKAYADALIATGNNKGTARVATTASLTLTSATATTIVNSGGLPTVLDGVTLAAGDIILVKDQSGAGSTGAAANGLYVYATGTTWTRTTNADISAEVKAGLFVFVSEGTANGNNGYTLTTDDPITLGTTQLTFTQTSGAGQIVAGAGLTKTGNTIDVGGTADRITINADTVDIASTYIGQSTITTVGTLTSGALGTGFTAVAIAQGGTNATTAAGARTNLSAAGLFTGTFTNSNLTAGVLTITHNLNNQAPIIFVYDNNNRWIVPDEVTASSANAVAVDLSSFGTLSGTWRYSVTG
jgi:hypothetical protein